MLNDNEIEKTTYNCTGVHEGFKELLINMKVFERNYNRMSGAFKELNFMENWNLQPRQSI